jgi:transmembrane 9 superfamily protein 2/4
MVQGAAFVELYFVLSSLFASRAYYAFGFVALTAGIVTLTTAMVSILFTYFILCAEEYRSVGRPSFPAVFPLRVTAILTNLKLCRWHWRSFLIGGGSAFWVLAYGLFYWASRLSLYSGTSVVLYLGYLFLIAFLDFLITGASPPILPTFADADTVFFLSSQVPSAFWHRIGLCVGCTVPFA